MADFINNLFGGQKPVGPSGGSSDDSDFADFAGAPDPSPASFTPVAASPAGGQPAPTNLGAALPYTKWYRVWERASPSDFILEAVVLPFIILAVLVHVWGRKANRRIAQRWATSHAPALYEEFAVVGFGGRKAPSMEEVEKEGLAKMMASEELELANELIKEKSPQEFLSYATGRKNVAFLDVKIQLLKRFNPVGLIGEYATSTFFDSFPAPSESVSVILYPFDGKEADLVPVPGGEHGQQLLEQRKRAGSTYDGFVWAIVNKEGMKRFRDERYDLSLTSTKDNPKLPPWATVMSESAEITDFMLEPELIEAVKKIGDALDYLIITDQPLEKPVKLDETIPKKRIFLGFRLLSPDEQHSTVPLFSCFLRLADKLVTHAHFRPEVLRKVRQTRDTQIKQLAKANTEDLAEERAIKKDKERKEKRDALLKGLNAEEQRKFLDKEREKEVRKSQKKQTSRG